MPVTDPRDPKIDRWLRSMEPRQELVVRIAMRQRFAEARADRKFTARVDELRQQFNDEDKHAMILADARMVAKEIDKVLGEMPPATNRTARIKAKRPRRER